MHRQPGGVCSFRRRAACFLFRKREAISIEQQERPPPRSRAAGEAAIWPEHDYKPFEIKDKNVRRVGFVIRLKADETVDVAVTLAPAK